MKRVGNMEQDAVFTLAAPRKRRYIYIKQSSGELHSICKRYVVAHSKGIQFNNFNDEVRLNNDHIVSHVFKSKGDSDVK